MGYSRKEYWSGLPRPPPRDLPDPGIKLASLTTPALASRFFITSATWEALNQLYFNIKFKTVFKKKRTFVGKVMSLLFNMLFGLVIAFLPRSKCLLISWLQSPSAVILDPKKNLSLFPLFPNLFAMN